MDNYIRRNAIQYLNGCWDDFATNAIAFNDA
jgi:hypothetical protein